jgi:hypothetical protein
MLYFMIEQLKWYILKHLPLKLEKDIKKILKEAGKPMGFGYKGLVNTGHEDEDGKINYGISNQLRLSSIPKTKNHSLYI